MFECYEFINFFYKSNSQFSLKICNGNLSNNLGSSINFSVIYLKKKSCKKGIYILEKKAEIT